MILLKILDFFMGYVIISLRGRYTERFINICVRRGIRVWRIRRRSETQMTLCMRMADFVNIRSVARKTYVKVHIIQKKGLPALMRRYRKRYVLFVGTLLVLICAAVMSGFVWIVEVRGTENIPPERVLQAAAEAGIYKGARKSALKDVGAVRNIISDRINELAWVWVYIDGVKATIEVKEKSAPPYVVDKKTPCDVVALRDGIIKQITVKEGNTYLKPGDAVLAGETVIYGTMLNSDNTKVSYVHALGIVEVYTNYEKSGEYKLYKEIRTPTGKSEHKYTLNLFSKQFRLYRNENVQYKEYNKTQKNRELTICGIDTGIGLSSVDYDEVSVTRESISEDTATEYARDELEALIAAQILPQSQLTDRNITYDYVDDETIRVTVSMSFTERIGTEKPIQIQEEAYIAKTN